MNNTILVTGGAGFIGSALVRHLVLDKGVTVVNIDKLTYAGSQLSLASVNSSSLYNFAQIDICDSAAVRQLFSEYKPRAIMHLAAESHVDRSIAGPAVFVETNIVGTFTLLEAARDYWNQLNSENKNKFRFLHVSTDEVFGELSDTGFFTEETPYQPNSPYSASKAASDHLVRAWHHTYGLPTVMTNCSNNYGPFQFPEKLIPVVILNALRGNKIPVYGKGNNIRDWLFVDDHVSALCLALEKGRVGETYAVGCKNERTTLQITNAICTILDKICPSKNGESYLKQISFVTDRAGHDFRYAIDPTKITTELGWKAAESFESGLEKTVQWYLDNTAWIEGVSSKK